MRKRLSAWVSRRKSKITSQETSADSADDAASMIGLPGSRESINSSQGQSPSSDPPSLPEQTLSPSESKPPSYEYRSRGTSSPSSNFHPDTVATRRLSTNAGPGNVTFNPESTELISKTRPPIRPRTKSAPMSMTGGTAGPSSHGRPSTRTQSTRSLDHGSSVSTSALYPLFRFTATGPTTPIHPLSRFRTPATSPSPEGDDHRSTSVRMSTKSSSGPNSRGAMMASSSTRRGISSAAEHDDFSVNSIPPRPETRSPNGQDRSLGHKIPTSLDTAARPSTTPSPTRHQRSSSSGSLSEATHTIAAQGHSGTQSPFWVKVEPHPELICGRQRWYPEETKCVTELVSKVMFTKTMDTFYCTVPKVRRVDRPTHSSYTPELGLGATTASRKNSSISTKEQKEKREWLQWCYLYKKDVEDMFLQRPSLANEQRVDKLCELLAEHMTRCLDDAFRGVSKAEDLNVKVLKDTTIKDSDIFKSKNSTIEVPLNETKPIVKVNWLHNSEEVSLMG